MPHNAPKVKVRAIESYGGKITFCEPTIESRESICAKLVESSGSILIHPYDNDRIIAGQGTAALELLEEVPDLDFIIAPVSGGGLLSGTSIASRGLRQEIRIIGGEPKNADDAFRSLREGQPLPIDHPDTMADGLRASLSPRTFAILRSLVNEISLVTEDEIVNAMRFFWERMKIIVEPSGAVAAAPALNRRIGAEGRKVGVILSGGNVDLGALPFK